ncbi:putative Coiled-coil domain-containing protein 39 [Hypsibius exemplaris]|uniref:Coiled-coil domain-containing protein 39 n=1 Tax=Hypsibius exemplaris TaxID=2072580 RepID=A0A1W0WU91_HYPEX|nr:putative Coiled-coil domain-containing protein 39 [Hypsibius exemplaris]
MDDVDLSANPGPTGLVPSSTSGVLPKPLHTQQSVLTGEKDDPWWNEHTLPDGRNAANPEYLMGHPQSVDDHTQGNISPAKDDDRSGSPLPPPGLWDDEVANLEKELVHKLDRAEEEKEKLELLKSKRLRRKRYVETLQIQFRSLQSLKNARQDEVDSMQKQVDLERLETAHLGLEKHRSHEHAKQLVARCGRAENVMNRLKKEITNLQTETDLDRELMDACLTYSDKHEAEFKMLERYCREDEEKLKDCMFRVDRLSVDEEKSQKDEEAMESLTKSTRLEYERIQQQVREGNANRDAHVDHWSKIKTQAHSGEKDMQRLHDEMDSIAAKKTAKLEALARQREFYESELRNNSQMERRLEGTEFNAIKARDFVIEMKNKKRELLDQIHAFENACATKRRTIKSLKVNVKNLSQQTHRVKEDITKWRDLAHAMGAKNSEVSRKNLTDEERLAELNRILDERETLVRAAEQKVIKLRDINYKKTQQNANLRAQLDAATMTVRGNSLYLNNLYGQLKNNKAAAHNQSQQIYELEYKVIQLERRIAFIEGTDTGPSEKSLEEARQLQIRKGHVTAEGDLMRSRIFKQEEWIKNLKKEVDSRNAEQKKNEIALAEIMLYLHTTERSVDKARAKKILFKERMAAVALEREEYRAQRNRVEEQRSWFVKILRELEHQQRGVKTRFEMLTLPIQGLDQGQGDSTDIVQIQAAFFVKAASEKQSVINHRTQLKNAIQKVMQDNFRLRQFLEKYEAQTHDIKNNVLHVKQKSVMDQRQQNLDDEIAFLRERLRTHESHLLRRTTDKLDLLQDKVQQGMRQENSELRTLMAELDEARVRLDRTLKQNGVMLSGIKKNISAEDWPLIKVEIEASLYMDAERLLYSTIKRFLDAYPEAFTTIEHLFQEMSIEMSEELTKTLLRSASGSKHSLASPSSSGRLVSAR